jgi:DNA polymerase III delta prime subunit
LINKEKDEIGIDDIRELKKKLLFKPVSQYRIVLIEQAQNLTEEASNAILKILEDMAPPTFFIFLSTRLLKPTIISRLEVIKFHLLSDEEVAGFFEGDDINNNINCHSESRKAGRRILLNSERSFVAPLCGAPQDDKRETVNYKKEVQDEIQYLAAGRAGKLIDLISSPERLQSSINFFNKFVAMMKLSMKGKLVCIDDYLKNDGKTDVFLESWLKILTDSMVSDLTGQARIPNSLKEKLRHCEPSETLCPSVALSGGGRFGHLQNLNSKYKEVAKSLKQILVLKELDSRYNLNKKLLLEQLAIE